MGVADDNYGARLTKLPIVHFCFLFVCFFMVAVLSLRVCRYAAVARITTRGTVEVTTCFGIRLLFIIILSISFHSLARAIVSTNAGGDARRRAQRHRRCTQTESVYHSRSFYVFEERAEKWFFFCAQKVLRNALDFGFRRADVSARRDRCTVQRVIIIFSVFYKLISESIGMRYCSGQPQIVGNA